MKKIMFSDKFALTQAVLEGRKTQTRRIVSERLWDRWTEYDDYCNSVGVSGLSEMGVSVTREYYDCAKFLLDNSPYKVGEVVAVAQCYKDCGLFDVYRAPKDTAGWTNKMFVKAALMPHRIRITDVRVERLNDISEADCRAEGIVAWTKDKELYKYDLKDVEMFPWSEKPHTPREAYAALIDKISGKGTFESNPYVFAYTFQLIK